MARLLTRQGGRPKNGRWVRFQSRGPEVAGSNPAPATKTKTRGALLLPFHCLPNNLGVNTCGEFGSTPVIDIALPIIVPSHGNRGTVILKPNGVGVACSNLCNACPAPNVELPE
jgi:hypothetical protein